LSDPGDVSVIIPVLDDAHALARLLDELQAFGGRGLQVIVVDGGSRDDSVQVAQQRGVLLIESTAGRGQQLNTGVCQSTGSWLWMLHTDCRVPLSALTFIRSQRAIGWGRFDVTFDPDTPMMRLIGFMINWRSRFTGICTGDQGIFVHRRLLERIGGIPEQSLMEDIELSHRLKRLCAPVCAHVRLTVSPRRWRRDGAAQTILMMWRLRLRYWRGASPEDLALEYYGLRTAPGHRPRSPC
jgi:rSAM/selenodomain-associated transferase 2